MPAALLLQKEDALLFFQMETLGGLYLALYLAEDKQANEVNQFWAERNERAVVKAKRDIESWEGVMRKTRERVEERRRIDRGRGIYEEAIQQNRQETLSGPRDFDEESFLGHDHSEMDFNEVRLAQSFTPRNRRRNGFYGSSSPASQFSPFSPSTPTNC